LGDVVLINATVGPNILRRKDVLIENATVKKDLIQTNSQIKNATLDNAMIGNHARFDNEITSVNIGDYSVLERLPIFFKRCLFIYF
jgi:glucose-1-phosphate thymidylyltransferase